MGLQIKYYFAVAATFIFLTGTALAMDMINVNTAPADELIKLHLIGPKKAQRIIDYREKHGPFKKADDLLKVKGIGPKTLEKIKPQITFGQEEKAEVVRKPEDTDKLLRRVRQLKMKSAN